MFSQRRWRSVFLAAISAAIFLLILTYRFWLPWFGTHLVDPSAAVPYPMAKADAVVVLAGDFFGLRVLKGGELVSRDKLAPVVLVSGPGHVYGVSEAKLAIDLAERAGYDRRLFEALPFDYFSTEQEAQVISNELVKRGVVRVIVVTSNYHTGRAGRIWRRYAAGKFGVQMAAAPDHDFVPETWWQNREGRKKAFYEWMKLMTGPLGI